MTPAIHSESTGFFPFLFVPIYPPPDAKDLAETFGWAEDHEVTTGLFFSQRNGKVAPMGLLTKMLGGDFRAMFFFSKLFSCNLEGGHYRSAVKRGNCSTEAFGIRRSWAGWWEFWRPHATTKTTTLKRLFKRLQRLVHTKNSGLNSFLRKLLL